MGNTLGMSNVAIVGAGLSGLRCAVLLAEAGYEVEVHEASDGVGGRARTDEIEGFRLDRGFQVLLTAYPEAKRAFDYGALDLGEFEPGALIRLNGDFAPVVDPLRRPDRAFSSLASPAIGIADKLRIGRMAQELVLAGPEKVLSRPDVTALESLRARGFSEKAIERFFRPFFGGVLIDPELESSSRMLEIFFRCFAIAPTALPAGGMGRLADQLAAMLPVGSIHLESPVREVRADGVRLDDGDWTEAEAVVVAVDERSAAGLIGTPEPRVSRVTTTIYFDAPESDVDSRTLFIAPRGQGPINEVGLPSSAASGYAPPGRSLVAVTMVGAEAQREDLEPAVRSQLADWFGPDRVASWNLLSSYTIRDALPDFEPGRFEIGGQSPRLESGLFVCGDYRESPSIQGALVSGRKAARAVIEQL